MRGAPLWLWQSARRLPAPQNNQFAALTPQLWRCRDGATPTRWGCEVGAPSKSALSVALFFTLTLNPNPTQTNTA